MADPALEPLKPPEAKKLARDIAETGVIDVSGHAREEMANDELETTDCLNLLRAGVFNPPEYINGEWRYRVTSSIICVVIAFMSETRLRVVTAWRIKR
jgi:hypothetical protein